MNKEEFIKYSTEIKEINTLRSKEYQEFKSLMYKWIDFSNSMTQSEPCYINLWVINAFIEDFESKVIQSVGERNINAEKHLKTLYDIHAQYGKFYFESIAYRQKVQELQSDVLKMSKKIAELQNENDKLKKINEF
jgi:hypothetical protein